jgi:hypothetical protein
VEGAGWLLFMLEICENLARGRPPAQGIRYRVELPSRVLALSESVARKREGFEAGQVGLEIGRQLEERHTHSSS